jgi:hypothetical protein
VEAREGDTWSPATVVKREGRRFQVRYDDGTEEWVTADRLRAAGGAGAGAGAPGGGGGAPGAGAKPPAKEQYAVGAKIEAKEAGSWKPATVRNRDGDLYLVVFDGWEKEFFWQWVHLSMVRAPGGSKEGPEWGHGVGVHNGASPRPRPRR